MGSPIEEMLLEAIRAAVPAGHTLYDYTDEGDAYEFDKTHGIRPISRSHPAYNADLEREAAIYGEDPDLADDRNQMFEIWSGVRAGSYRADFVIERDKWRRLVVECDGHDFHDRTKQQAAYDRARDRELLRLGLPTIRFTGSEIHHSPERCAAEVWACMSSMLDIDDYSTDAWRSGYDCGERAILKRCVAHDDITESLGG